MGFLASLFGRAPVEDKKAQEQEDIEAGVEKWGDERAPQGVTPFPRLTVGEHLEVSVDGEPLLSGRIASIHGRTLTIKREPNQFALQVCEVGVEVHVRGCSNGILPFELKGIVTESTKTSFTVKDLAVMDQCELRADFRLSINVPATLYEQEDIHFQKPEECSLVNISAGGACVQSKIFHSEGEVLWLKVRLMNYAPITVLGQIVRAVEPTPGVFQYGFLFAELDEQVSKNLAKMLINIQTGNTQPHFRRDGGHW